jgi:hypothetical protein
LQDGIASVLPFWRAMNGESASYVAVVAAATGTGTPEGAAWSAAREAETESVGLRQSVLTLGDMDGRDGSGDVAVLSALLLLPPPPPIMRRRNPLRFGLITFDGASSTAALLALFRPSGAGIPRREERDSPFDLDLDCGWPSPVSRARDFSRGGVVAAFRRAAADRSLSR